LKVVLVSLDKQDEMYRDKISAEWKPMSGGNGSGSGAGGAGGNGSVGQEQGAGGQGNGGAAKGGGAKRLSDEEHFQNMINAPEPNLQEQLAGLGSMDRQLVDPSPEQKREEDNFWRGPPRGVLAKNMMRAGRAMTNTYKNGSGVKKGGTSAKEGGVDTEGMTSVKNILNEMKELEERRNSAKKSRTSTKAPEEDQQPPKDAVASPHVKIWHTSRGIATCGVLDGSGIQGVADGHRFKLMSATHCKKM